jgi:hypothetical protein
MQTLRRASYLVAAWLFVAHAALAQPKKPPSIRSELPPNAQQAWDNAQQLVRANDCRGAIPEFTRAYEISKNPRVLFNIAICEKELRNYARAATRFEQELAEGAGKLTPEEKAEIENAIAIVRKFVTTIEVTANEPGATFFIDDYEMGKTPFAKRLPIDVGGHTLKLTKDGFKESTQRVEVATGTPAKVIFKLEPITRMSLVTINVTGAPAATIYVDGTDMGPAPFKGNVQVGRRTFTAKANGYVTAEQTTEVKYGEALNIVLGLAQERHEGKVRIEADPPGSVIEIDGRVVGSNFWEGVLPSRGYQLIVKKPGYQTFSQEIVVADDQTRTVKASLSKEKQTSWVWWTIGSVAVVGAGAAVGYFVFKPSEVQPVEGTTNPSTAFTGWGF